MYHASRYWLTFNLWRKIGWWCSQSWSALHQQQDEDDAVETTVGFLASLLVEEEDEQQEYRVKWQEGF